MNRLTRIVFLMLTTLVVSSATSTACSVCFGDPDSPMTKGMAAGILTLLCFITIALTGISAFFIYVIRRPEAGEPEPTEGDSPSGSETKFE